MIHLHSVHVLTDTYEQLYELTRPLAEKMNQTICKISGWKQECNDILQNLKREKKLDVEFHELDLYYLLKILENLWHFLEENEIDPFYSEENRLLFVACENDNSILNIRNTVMHPEDYNENAIHFHNYEQDKVKIYKDWEDSIAQAARQLGFEMQDKISGKNKKEAEELKYLILHNSTYKNMASDEWKNLSEEGRKRRIATRNRIESQSTAAGIMALFKDAAFLDRGKDIQKESAEHGLVSFEDILDKIYLQYYGFTE